MTSVLFLLLTFTALTDTIITYKAKKCNSRRVIFAPAARTVMKYVIDRIVDGVATLLTLDEKEESISAQADRLYLNAKEGDIVEETDGGFVFLADETAARRNALESRFKRLAKRRSDR